MRTHGIYKKIKPSRILIILQCIASVIRPEVVMQIKKKLKKNSQISNLRYMYEQTK